MIEDEQIREKKIASEMKNQRKINQIEKNVE